MNYEEIERITKELKKKEKELVKLQDKADLIQNEMEELHDNLQCALIGDMSYMVMGVTEETEETLQNI